MPISLDLSEMSSMNSYILGLNIKDNAKTRDGNTVLISKALPRKAFQTWAQFLLQMGPQ